MATNKRLIKSNDEGGAGGASFNTVLYTGTNASQDITGVGFQPDLVWIKSRTSSTSNNLFDTVRGATTYIRSDQPDPEGSNATMQTSFNPDGFSLGNDETYQVNWSGKEYVAWCWKAGGAAVTNNDGTTPSQVSANTEAGFSIVTWTTNLSPATLRVGHGLGQTPDIVIFKRRSSPNEDWYVLSNLFDGSYLLLNSTSALTSLGSSYSTSVTDTLLSSFTSAIGIDYVAYCFAEVAGFSKFGSYEGTGVVGQSITGLGFEPAFLMIKNIDDGTTAWRMWDNKRPVGALLSASSSQEEQIVTSVRLDADGFTLQSVNTQWNNSGKTFVYMAFANQF